MDKKEFEKMKNEMQDELIKLFWDGVELLKKELGIDDGEVEEEAHVEAHVNPEVKRGDWIVFEGKLTDEMNITLTEPFELVQYENGMLGFYDHVGDFNSLFFNDCHTGRYRLATEREIMFAEAGRDVGEFRTGDIVSHNGDIYCVSYNSLENILQVNKNILLDKEKCFLVCPVDSRLDRKNKKEF